MRLVWAISHNNTWREGRDTHDWTVRKPLCMADQHHRSPGVIWHHHRDRDAHFTIVGRRKPSVGEEMSGDFWNPYDNGGDPKFKLVSVGGRTRKIPLIPESLDFDATQDYVMGGKLMEADIVEQFVKLPTVILNPLSRWRHEIIIDRRLGVIVECNVLEVNGQVVFESTIVTMHANQHLLEEVVIVKPKQLVLPEPAKILTLGQHIREAMTRPLALTHG